MSSEKLKAKKREAITCSGKNFPQFKASIKMTLRKSNRDPAFAAIDLFKNQVGVWKVTNNQLEAVAEEDVGIFHEDYSYLVLSVFVGDNDNSQPSPIYNVFLWIGQHSSIKEYTLLAIKAVELSFIKLMGQGTHHREVQGKESEKFLSLFERFQTLKAEHTPLSDATSEEKGFLENSPQSPQKPSLLPKPNTSQKLVRRTAPKNKLFHVTTFGKTVTINEVSYRFENIISKNVYIILMPTEIIQLNNKCASTKEKKLASKQVNLWKKLDSKKKITIIEEGENGYDHPVISSMPRKNKMTLKRREQPQQSQFEAKLFKMIKNKGKLAYTLLQKAPFKRSMLENNGVYIIDNGDVCYVWVGAKTKVTTKHYSIIYGTGYLESCQRLDTSLECVCEGAEPPEFRKLFE